MKFTVYHETRIGKRRNNEDRLGYSYAREALLMVVADGMGGHYYGEIAAHIAVQTLTEAFDREAKPKLNDPFMFLRQGFNHAHKAILDFANMHELADSPRTTCVGCVVQGNVAYWAHSGDSRLYMLRKGKVLARTKDHSRVQALVDQGVISEREMPDHADRNKIYGCLGGQQAPEITYSRKTPMEAGDVLILCSDGLWSGISGEFLASSVRNTPLARAIPALLDAAESKEGAHTDNLSALGVRWEDTYVDANSASGVISTRTMNRHTVTTKMDGFGRSPDHKTDLSDEEIERTIGEINAAINKSLPYANSR